MGGVEVCRCVGDHMDGNELLVVVYYRRRGHNILFEVQRHNCVVEINNIGEEGQFDGNDPVGFKYDGGR